MQTDQYFITCADPVRANNLLRQPYREDARVYKPAAAERAPTERVHQPHINTQ